MGQPWSNIGSTVHVYPIKYYMCMNDGGAYTMHSDPNCWKARSVQHCLWCCALFIKNDWSHSHSPFGLRTLGFLLSPYDVKPYNFLLKISSPKINPANTKHLYTICTTSAQRLRRWSNIVQMLYKCFVFAGKMIYMWVSDVTCTIDKLSSDYLLTCRFSKVKPTQVKYIVLLG